ncbi:MAG: EamA family transporter [Bacilli bacterium]
MFAVAVCLVVLSGLFHAVWNLFAKQSINKIVFLWSLQWVAVIVYLPWAVAAILRVQVPPLGYGLLFVTAALHGVYVILLSRTYSFGDLSQVYPLMRGVSPLLLPIIGVAILGERLTGSGWIGVALIVAGIGILGGGKAAGHSEAGAIRPEINATATWWALAVGVSITCYTAFDKITLRYIPAVTLTDAGNFGNLLALSWWAARSGAIRTEWRVNWKTIVLGGVISPGGYLLFLLALQFQPLARVAPMREIGTVFGAILGIVVLKEPQGRQRIAASTLIAAGVLILGVLG